MGGAQSRRQWRGPTSEEVGVRWEEEEGGVRWEEEEGVAGHGGALAGWGKLGRARGEGVTLVGKKGCGRLQFHPIRRVGALYCVRPNAGAANTPWH